MLYSEITWINEPEYIFYREHYFCIDTPKGKMHIKCTWDGVEDGKFEFIGSCDGICNRILILEQKVSALLVRDSNTTLEERPVRSADCPDDESVEWQIATSLAEKVVTKTNRWTRRYRWTRQRHSVSDLS